MSKEKIQMSRKTRQFFLMYLFIYLFFSFPGLVVFSHSSKINLNARLHCSDEFSIGHSGQNKKTIFKILML